MTYQNKVVLVTGGAKGVGGALQGAEIHRLGEGLHPDAEIAACQNQPPAR